MFPIIILCSVLFLGYCSPAFTEDAYIIPIGQNQVFTQCNYHNTWFTPDYIPGYPGPWSGTHSALSEGNEATVSMQTNPGYAGRNFAEIGVQFQWDLGGYNWEDVKGWPVKVTFELSYTIWADYEIDKGTTANAGVLIPAFFKSGGPGVWQPGINCLDWVGNETNNHGPNSATSRVVSFSKKSDGSILTIENLFDKVFLHAHCQSNSALSTNSNSLSSTHIEIKSIKIEFMPRKNYGLFIGINNPPIDIMVGQTRVKFDLVHGVESAEFVVGSWEQLKECEFKILRGDFGYNVDNTLTIDTIKSTIIANLPGKVPGDNYIFYFCGHGGFDPDKNKEFLRISKTELLYKDDLAALLQPVWLKGLNIWVILDCCHSGGFWSNALEFYDHTCLIASSYNDSFGDASFGYGVFSQNLAWLLREQRKNNILDVNGDTIIDFNEFKAGIKAVSGIVLGYIGQPVSIMEDGEIVIFNLDMWAPVAQKSADFNGVLFGEPKEGKTLPCLMLLLD
jgi:hypothetical protein